MLHKVQKLVTIKFLILRKSVVFSGVSSIITQNAAPWLHVLRPRQCHALTSNETTLLYESLKCTRRNLKCPHTLKKRAPLMCECVLECLLQPGSPPPSPESAHRAVFTSAARWHLDHYWQRNLHGALKTAESAEHSHTHTHTQSQERNKEPVHLCKRAQMFFFTGCCWRETFCALQNIQSAGAHG